MEEKALSEVEVICDMCGRAVLAKDAIRHHIDPSRKTKEPGALAKKDLREKKDLLYVCRPCHGKIHAKLMKSVKERNEDGKWVTKRIYKDDNPEGSIWR